MRGNILSDKPTAELMQALSSAKSIDNFMAQNNQFLLQGELSEHINRLCTEKELVKAQIIKRAELNEIYAYQIFSGKRMPSRDKLLCLCIGMQLNATEINQLLKSVGFASLYPKSKRDSIIWFGAEQGYCIMEINDCLYDNGEKTLN